MKVLVPVKRVIDPYAKVRPLSDGSGIDTSGVKFDINPFDEIAVEEAVRMKESNPAVEIIVISIGGAESEEQLRKALAMGADRAILVESAREHDSLTIATELAAHVAEIQPNLVLMGKQSTDGDNNQTGQMLAAKLGWPQATFASKIELFDGAALVTRETDNGEEMLQLPLPSVVTTDLRLNEPRYIAMMGIIKARSKPLDKVAEKTTAQPKVKYLKFEAPAPRAAGRKVGSVDELVSALKAQGVAL
ncbi:MAG: electron transfer flavoprotein subunit beta/FixA family protein [Chthonomonas sp.]|nr:electron transfer flavoprotein subunit beta/FixA family protein [Chthonomonas sp.]